MKKNIMLTMIMALGITASVMSAPTAIDEKDVPPAEVTMARLHAAPQHELGYIIPDFDNDPKYKYGNGNSNSANGCSVVNNQQPNQFVLLLNRKTSGDLLLDKFPLVFSTNR